MTPNLDAIRDNPAADWHSRGVERAGADANAGARHQQGGAFLCKMTYRSQRDTLKVPARRPIKPVYIRKLVAYLSDPGAIDA